jgi:hypothetical protein
LGSRRLGGTLGGATIALALPASATPFAVSSLGTRLDPHNGVLAAQSQEALFGFLDDFDIDSLTIGDG